METRSLGMRASRHRCSGKNRTNTVCSMSWIASRPRSTTSRVAAHHLTRSGKFQAHNLAYNVSTEFDDYRQRYEMVREARNSEPRASKQEQKSPLTVESGTPDGSTDPKLGPRTRRSSFAGSSPTRRGVHEQLRDQGIDVLRIRSTRPVPKTGNWLIGRLWCNTGLRTGRRRESRSDAKPRSLLQDRAEVAGSNSRRGDRKGSVLNDFRSRSVQASVGIGRPSASRSCRRRPVPRIKLARSTNLIDGRAEARSKNSAKSPDSANERATEGT